MVGCEIVRIIARPHQLDETNRDRPRLHERGEPVDPKLIYFRTRPKFETGAENYQWLMQHLFVGSAERHADRVVIDVHQVL